MVSYLLLFLGLLTVGIDADTVANCTYEEIRGTWTFLIGAGNNDNTLKCDSYPAVVSKLTVKLFYPDMAVDEIGNIGYWTLIYNQGFEVRIGGRSYFAFSEWTNKGESICNATLPGWTHDDTGHDWACYYGLKTNEGLLEVEEKRSSWQHVKPQGKATKSLKYRPRKLEKFGNNAKLIETVNTVQSSWTADAYAEYEVMTREEVYRRAGGALSSKRRTKAAPVTKEQLEAVKNLPESFDWRNVNGVSFVSPVRNQGGCGSCYTFATMAMLEARLRILTNNTKQFVFSPQNVVDCCEYSQGCDGGFGYLVSKYAQDFGVVDDSCYPYSASTGQCKSTASCKRHYAQKYGYVGGYYGACNEVVMKKALLDNGPMVVNFEVYDDFMAYKGGVYRHVKETRELGDFNPFEITNHAVLLVGYGVDGPTGLPYWSVKNSWGTSWGEAGYFRIIRGTDECGIESMAEEAFSLD